MDNFFTFSLFWMKLLLAHPRDNNWMDWAHDVCTASRLIHVDIWTLHLSHAFVKKAALPLMKEALDALDNLMNSGKDSLDVELLEAYGMNNSDRIDNIEKNYLKGKSSAFIAHNRLRELVKMRVA